MVVLAIWKNVLAKLMRILGIVVARGAAFGVAIPRLPHAPRNPQPHCPSSLSTATVPVALRGSHLSMKGDFAVKEGDISSANCRVVAVAHKCIIHKSYLPVQGK